MFFLTLSLGIPHFLAFARPSYNIKLQKFLEGNHMSSSTYWVQVCLSSVLWVLKKKETRKLILLLVKACILSNVLTPNTWRSSLKTNWSFPCTIMFADPNTGESCPFHMHPRSTRHGINNYIKILSRGHETNRILTAQGYGYKESHNNSHSIKPVATVWKTGFQDQNLTEVTHLLQMNLRQRFSIPT